VPWASCGASQADARTHITGWQATFPCPLKGPLPGVRAARIMGRPEHAADVNDNRN
jgi:hypothetical protein